MDRTIRTIQDAIHANHGAQEVIVKQLEAIARKKERNRRNAAAIVGQIPVTSMLDNLVGPPARRRWTRKFFVDKQGSVPKPNADSLLRQQLESQTVSIQTNPLWSTKEIDFLHDRIASEQQQQQEQQQLPVNEEIDFVKIASTVNKKFGTNRSAEECQVKYQPNRAPITKQESLELLKQFHNGQELTLPGGRSKWQAFQAFHSADDKKDPWTAQQDKVLFQTVAAAGPQQVLDQHFAANLSGVLQKHPKAVLQRTMTSLLNPNFVNDIWSDEDERRLCLLMKVYRDSPTPYVSISSHFPNRGSRSVHDKWTRTLDPQYESGRPFTKDEDDKLRQIPNPVDWKELEQHFPGRISQGLAKRWKDLVSQEQIVDVYRRNRKRKFKEFDQEDVVLRIKPP